MYISIINIKWKTICVQKYVESCFNYLRFNKILLFLKQPEILKYFARDGKSWTGALHDIRNIFCRKVSYNIEK